MNLLSQYENLLRYYRECFDLLDCIHFNSDISRSVYERNLVFQNGITIPITHRGINDNRRKKVFSERGLKIGFIGNKSPYKGLHILLSMIRNLDVDVFVWGGRIKEELHIHNMGRFSSHQEEMVFESIDVLVVPSFCKETFSFVALEALSYGVPVIVSDNVGAQIIVKEYDSSFVYHTEDELRCLLSELEKDKSRLIDYNASIIRKPWHHNMRDHTKEIIEKIYGVR